MTTVMITRSSNTVPAQYKAGATHAIYASGGPADGSLYGFYTACGLQVGYLGTLADWHEQPALSIITCKRCVRALSGGHNAGTHNEWVEAAP